VEEVALSVDKLPGRATAGTASAQTAALQVIVNPASGNGRARKRWPAMAAELMNRGLEHQVTFTSGPNEATDIARRLAEGGAETIVAVGGDGTVNEIINGMIADGKPVNPRTSLLVLPTGTGKDLGRTLGTGQIEDAMNALMDRSVTHMDIGAITYTTSSGKQVTRHFANVADLGLGATVAERISRSSKRLGGLLTYLVAAVRSIISYSPGKITVEIGDDTIFEGAANMVVLANGQYFAGGMHVAPTASICDGLLEMYILADVGRRSLLTSLLPRVYRGKHVGKPGVFHVRAGSVVINSDDEMLLEMDGEQVGRAPVTVHVLPQVLPVVIARSRRSGMAGCESA
jgi:diacylglycerol kinase (ATP)